MELSIEQQFAMASFNRQVDAMSPDQMRDVLKQLHQAYIVQQASYQQMIKHEWGIGNHEFNQRTTEG
jgi:Phycobilisome degradation protein nblA